jgi:hypothetical protein
MIISLYARIHRQHDLIDAGRPPLPLGHDHRARSALCGPAAPRWRPHQSRSRPSGAFPSAKHRLQNLRSRLGRRCGRIDSQAMDAGRFPGCAVACGVVQVTRGLDDTRTCSSARRSQEAAKKCRDAGSRTLKPDLINATGDRGVCLCAPHVNVYRVRRRALGPLAWGVGVSRVELEIDRVIAKRSRYIRYGVRP